MPERDRVALPLGELSHALEQGAVLDSFFGHTRRIGFRNRLVLDRPAQALSPAVGAKVVGLTISKEQRDFAQARIQAAIPWRSKMTSPKPPPVA